MTNRAESSRSAVELTLERINRRFGTVEAARKYLERIRWPDGPVCPHCGGCRAYRIAVHKAVRGRAGLLKCAECERQFTVTVGTALEGSHIPLHKWLIALYLLMASKKGMSALQMQRMLGFGSYETALFMLHRIRFCLQNQEFPELLQGFVEADETYIGGRIQGEGRNYRANKSAVVSLLERGGRVRSTVMGRVTAKNIGNHLREHVDLNAFLLTDESGAYNQAGKILALHASVNHSKNEYVRGLVHTNSAESYFALVKRGIHGVYHHVSKRHLPLYLSEFDFRYNQRNETDGKRTVAAIRMMEGKRLMLHRPLKIAA